MLIRVLTAILCAFSIDAWARKPMLLSADNSSLAAVEEITEFFDCRDQRDSMKKPGKAVFPVPEARVISRLGAARSGGRKHKGVDLAATWGAPVFAVWDGC